MDWLDTTSELLLAGYMMLCGLATTIVFSLRSLDFSRFTREDDDRSGAEGFFEYPGQALLVLLFGLTGLALLVYLGWRVPPEIERLYGSGGAFGWIMPDVTMTTLGKAAQMTGAACLFLIGLRWMKPVILVGLLASILVLGLLAFTYIFS